MRKLFIKVYRLRKLCCETESLGQDWWWAGTCVIDRRNVMM